MAEVALSSDPRYRARPTLRIDDQENAAVADRINMFRVDERVGGLSSLELRLTNTQGAESDDDVFVFENERDLALGSKLAIYSGDEMQPREIFRGVVTSIEAEFPDDGHAELVVLAEDALQSSRLARRSKTYDDLQISSLARDVANSLSLTPKITGFSDSVGVQVQLNESDLAFLRRMLDRYDGDLQVVGTELHVSPRKDVRRAAVELQYQGQLRHVRFVVDLVHQVTEVTTSGWDAAGGQRVSGTSMGANFGPGSGRAGKDVLADKLVSRSEHVGFPAVRTSAEARAVADAAFDARARRFVVAHGTVEGNALVRIGSHVTLKGTSRRFDNTYYVVHACHRFDLDRGYETDFEAECAFLGNP
jgi:phage protein D